MTILVIAAHPDDEVYGMGGTIAKLTSQGHEVHVLFVTDGCSAQYAENPHLQDIIIKKRREALAANKILGVKNIFFGDFPDMKLDTVAHIEINKLIEKTVSDLEPEIVFTHFYGDVNLDHQAVYRSTLVAVRPIYGQCVKKVYCYRVPSSTEWSPQLASTVFMPNVIVDVTDYERLKEPAILSYQTEIREYPHPRSVQYVKETDRARGLQWGLGSSEEFMLLRALL